MKAKARTNPWQQNLWVELGLLLLVMAIGAGLRFYAIAELPPGLYRDEAYNGLDALRVFDGEHPLFFEANNGREPLFVYLLALGVQLWGRTQGALRGVSALIGTCTIPCFYWVAREFYDRHVAWVVAVMAACSVWMLNTSRIVFRAGIMLPILALGLAAMARGLRLRRFGWMLMAGVMFGAGVYTYLAARLAAVALGIYLVADWRHNGRLWVRGWILLAVSALVVALPMIGYWLTADTTGRVGQVSILSSDMRDGTLLSALGTQAWRTALGFFLRGDFIPRHNIPLRPFLPMAYCLAMVVGIVSGLRRQETRHATVACLVWLAVMLVPTWLAEGAPHMLRASGILPVLFCLPALGLVETTGWLQRRGTLGAVGVIGLAAMMLFTSADNSRDYSAHLRSEAVYYNFEAGATELASDVNDWLAADDRRTAYVAQRLWDGWPSVQYLCPEQKGLHTFAQEQGPLLDHATTDVIIAAWPYGPMDAILEDLPAGRVISIREGARERQDLADDSRLLYLLATTSDPAAVPSNAQVAWEHGIVLRGYEVEVVADDVVDVTLYWAAEEPVSVDYTVFCHALSQGRLIGQHDGTPGAGYYETSRWRMGDTVCDTHRLVLTEAMADLEISVGLYAWPSMAHLRIVDSKGQSTFAETYRLLLASQ